jgi:hypothetical protein
MREGVLRRLEQNPPSLCGQHGATLELRESAQRRHGGDVCVAPTQGPLNSAKGCVFLRGGG